MGVGFLGRAVATSLTAAGVPTTVVHRSALPPGAVVPGADIRSVAGDAADTCVVDRALADAERVIWCAGGPMPAEAEQCAAASVDATLRPLITVLDGCAGRGVTHFLFLSSGGTVYGPGAATPTPETAVPQPTTAYGIARLAAEHFVHRAGDRHGIGTVVLRCSNVYGPHQPGDRSQGLVAAALSAARGGRPLRVFGDGQAVRDYLHVDDLVHAVCAVSRRGAPWPVLNVGTGVGHSVNEVLGAVAEATGSRLSVEYVPSRSCDADRAVLDVSRLRSTIDWDPMPLATGIARTAACIAAKDEVHA